METTDRTEFEFELDPARYKGHTKGRWSYGCDWGEYGAICDCGDDSEYVYGGPEQRKFPKIPRKEQIANARLIADSPRILALAVELEKRDGKQVDEIYRLRAKLKEQAGEIERLRELLLAAVLRVELATADGNPILSGWAVDARAALGVSK